MDSNSSLPLADADTEVMDIDIQIESEQPVQIDLSDPTAVNGGLPPASGTEKDTQQHSQQEGLTNERGIKRERPITPPAASPAKFTNEQNPYHLHPHTPKTPKPPRTTHLSPHKLLTPTSNPKPTSPDLEFYGKRLVPSPLTKKNLAAFEESLRRSNTRPLAPQDPWGGFGVASGMKKDRNGVSGGGFFGPALRDARAEMWGLSSYGAYPGYKGRGGDGRLPGTRKSYGQLALVGYAKNEGPALAHKRSSSILSSKLRKKARQQNKFGKPGPAGYWVPDDGVEKQLPPPADLVGGGGEEDYGEVPDYGGCEIWYDAEGDVVEARGMGWDDDKM